jgi:hypothetical protein
MGHPSERYVKFLLAQSWEDPEHPADLASVNLTLSAYSLPLMMESQYNKLRAAFQPPRVFQFNNKKHDETVKFMKDQSIYGLWNPTKEERRVFTDILDGNRLIKLTIQMLLMGGIGPEDISIKVCEKFQLDYPLEAVTVASYGYYFWNVTNATQEDWATMLHDDPYRSGYLASLHDGEAQALFRAGFRPTINSVVALQDAQRDIFFRIRAMHSWPDTDYTIDAMAKLVTKLITLHQILHAEGAGVEDLLVKFRKILLEHIPADIRLVDEIINKTLGGSISGDGSDNKKTITEVKNLIAKKKELVAKKKETKDD